MKRVILVATMNGVTGLVYSVPTDGVAQVFNFLDRETYTPLDGVVTAAWLNGQDAPLMNVTPREWDPRDPVNIQRERGLDSESPRRGLQPLD